MGKSVHLESTHFPGQPLYAQVIKLLATSKFLRFSRENGSERYTKCFNCRIHPVVMLYAVIMCRDSLREISVSMLAEARQLSRCLVTKECQGISLRTHGHNVTKTWESCTLRHGLCQRSCDEGFMEGFSLRMPGHNVTKTWESCTLRHGLCRLGCDEGFMEGIPSDVRFTSAATNDSFMLKPVNFHDGDVLAMDRAYIDYAKLEELTERDLGNTYRKPSSDGHTKSVE